MLTKDFIHLLGEIGAIELILAGIKTQETAHDVFVQTTLFLDEHQITLQGGIPPCDRLIAVPDLRKLIGFHPLTWEEYVLMVLSATLLIWRNPTVEASASFVTAHLRLVKPDMVSWFQNLIKTYYQTVGDED